MPTLTIRRRRWILRLAMTVWPSPWPVAGSPVSRSGSHVGAAEPSSGARAPIWSPCASALIYCPVNVHPQVGARGNMVFPGSGLHVSSKNSPVNLAVISSFAVNAFLIERTPERRRGRVRRGAGEPQPGPVASAWPEPNAAAVPQARRRLYNQVLATSNSARSPFS